MGEYADYILNGDDCQYCGEYLGDGDGFARACAACAGEERSRAPRKSRKPSKTVPCPHCTGKVHDKIGLRQHIAAKHPEKS